MSKTTKVKQEKLSPYQVDKDGNYSVKSITPKSIAKDLIKKENIGRPLFTVMGVATGKISVETKYGESLGVNGDFLAVHAETGEIIASDAAFLPKGFQDQIFEKLKEDFEIEFKCTVYLSETDKNERGYAYITKEPMTEERKNRMSLMREAAMKHAKLLLEASEDVKKLS